MMMNIQNVVHDTKEFSAVIRRLINDLAALQYNEAIAEDGADHERVQRYAIMMTDLRILDEQAIRVKLGVKQTTEGIGRIAEQLQLLAGIEQFSTRMGWEDESGFKTAPVDDIIPRE